MLCLRCLGHAVVVVYIRRQHARIYSYVVRTKKSPANTMGQEGSSSKAEQSMKRKGKGSFRQALRRQKSETVKTRIRRTSPRAKKANTFRRVPQQLFSSSAITGGEMGVYAEHVLRSRRDLSEHVYIGARYSYTYSHVPASEIFVHPGQQTQPQYIASTVDEGGNLSMSIVGCNRLWNGYIDRYCRR